MRGGKGFAKEKSEDDGGSKGEEEEGLEKEESGKG